MADEGEKKKKKKKKIKEDDELADLANIGTDKDKKKKKKKKDKEDGEATGESEKEEKKKKKKKDKGAEDTDGGGETTGPSKEVTIVEPPAATPAAGNTPRIDRVPTRASQTSDRGPSQNRGPSQQRAPSQLSVMPPIDRRASLAPSVAPPVDRRASLAPSERKPPSVAPPPANSRRPSMAPSVLSSGLFPPLKAPTQTSMPASAAPDQPSQDNGWWDKEWTAAPRRVIPPVSKDTWARMELLNKKLMAEPKQVKFEDEELPEKVDLTLEFYTNGQEPEAEEKSKDKKKKGKKGKDKDKDKDKSDKEKSDRDTDRETDREKDKKKSKKDKKNKKSSDLDETGDESALESSRSRKKPKSASDAEEKPKKSTPRRPKSERISGQTDDEEGEDAEEVEAMEFDPIQVVDPRMARIMARLSDARADPTESQLVDPIYPAKCDCCADRNDYTRGIIRDETVVARPHHIQKTIEDGLQLVRRRDNGLGFYRSDSRVLIPVSNYVEKHLSTEMVNAGYSHEEARKLEHIRTKASQSIPPNMVEWPYYPNGPALAQELERYVANDVPSGDSYVLSETINDSNVKLDDALRRLKKSISRF